MLGISSACRPSSSAVRRNMQPVAARASGRRFVDGPCRAVKAEGRRGGCPQGGRASGSDVHFLGAGGWELSGGRRGAGGGAELVMPAPQREQRPQRFWAGGRRVGGDGEQAADQRVVVEFGAMFGDQRG